jgi:hypothetical protein
MRREPWDAEDDLQPWEEIPIRLSPVDRAGADLAGSWRVVVTSLFAGSGTTTVTAALGSVLADIRGGGVVAVDVNVPDPSPGESSDGRAGGDPEPAPGVSLTRRLGTPAATTISALARHRRRGCSPEDVASLVTGAGIDPAGTGGPGTRLASGTLDVVAVRVADTRPPSAATRGALMPTDDVATPTSLRSALSLLGKAYPLVLLDAAGNGPLVAAALRGADVVILVVLANPPDLDAAAEELRDSVGLPSLLATEPPPVVIAVVVSARRGRWSPQTRAAVARLRRRVDGVVRVPYDVRLDADAGSPTKIGRLRRSSRRAYLTLASDIVDILVDEVDARAADAAAQSATGDGVTTASHEGTSL